LYGSGKLFSSALTEFLRAQTSEFEMLVMEWNMFPEKLSNFGVGRFWSSILKFWERARKLIQHLRSTWGLTMVWDFDQGLLCKSVTNNVKLA
jgi:hypothetical protein